MGDLFSVARIQLEKVFPTLSHALNLRTNCQEYGGFILRPTYYNPRDLIREGLRSLVALRKFTFLILPVLKSGLVSDDNCTRKKDEHGGKRRRS